MVDIPGDSTTGETLRVGDTATGTLEVLGDRDWFRIDLTAGQQIRVDLDGFGTAGVTDTYLRIRDASGNLLFENDDVGDGTNSSLAFAAPSSGTYFIEAGAWDDKETGGYQVKVSAYQLPPEFTFQQIADQLTNGYWGGASHHFTVTQGGSLTVNLTGLTAEGQYLARAALAQWTDIIGVTFTEVASGGRIIFNDDQDGAFSTANYSRGVTTTANVNVSTNWIADYGTTLTSYSFQTYLHEIGHALGLGHAGDYNTTAEYPYEALFVNDSWAASVMSYFSQTGNSFVAAQGFTRNYIATPMIADILAVSKLYGLSTTTRLGDTTYGPSWTTNMGAIALFDSGGNDTINVSSFSSNQLVNLNPGTYSNVLGEVGNVSIALSTIIENAIGGSGADTLIGNDFANVLTGGLGGDTLTGGLGKDVFLDSATDFNGDTIKDFQLDDRIVITDANAASYRYTFVNGTLSFAAASVKLLGVSTTTGLHYGAAPEGGIEVIVQRFGSPTVALATFGSNANAGSWLNNDSSPRLVADVNGDGRGDIIGFGNDGVFVSLGNASGTFDAPRLVTTAFGAAASAGGWYSDNIYHRLAADANGDGRADIIGFGNSGVYISLANADGSFAAPILATTAFGFGASAGGWASNDRYPRELADVNGDGRADVIGFGNSGVYVSLARADGTFANPTLATTSFGAAASAGGWSTNDLYVRHIGDVNGDGRADIVGFGNSGVYVSLGQADGSFTAATLGLNEFGFSSSAGGWVSDNLTPRVLGDVNGDKKVDVVGFSSNGVFVALGNGDGTFQKSVLDVNFFGSGSGAGNWTSENLSPRVLADVNHDGSADIIGFGPTGVYVAIAHADIWT